MIEYAILIKSENTRRNEVCIMEHEELEAFEFTDEERAYWIEMLVQENLREKVVTYDPEVLERIKTVRRHLELLLKQDNCDYKMEFERCPYFQQSLYLHLEVVDFGTSPKNFWLFEDVMRNINSFEAVWLKSGKVRLSFYFNFAFKEIK